MLQYNFKIEYKAGRQNTAADYMSRYQVSALENTYDYKMDEEQNKDPFIFDVKQYLNFGSLPSHSKEYASMVKRIGDAAYIVEGVVFYQLTPKKGRHRDCIIAPKNIRDHILHQAHSTELSGHGGSQQTLYKIYEAYWWPGITADVDNYIRKCQRCQLAKKSKPIPAPLVNIPIDYVAFERCHLDLFGPLRVSKTQKKYILAITDAFTRYAKVCAIENKTAKVVAEAFYKTWICNFGCPKEIVTDGGKEFTSDILKVV